MAYIKFPTFTLMAICILILNSCGKETDPQALQQAYIDQKVEEYRAYQKRACKKRVTDAAELRADSFFIEEAKKQSFDSVYRPQAITRPQKPQINIREDSLPLMPLIGDQTLDSTKLDSISPQ
jgi:hypothetical protein